jgi:uncharacterized protein YqeY
MSLDANLNNVLKEAMLAKDEAKIRTLRAIKSAFLLAKTEKGSSGDISEEQEMKVLQKLLSQRKESYEIFSREGRAELAAKEKEEMDIIASYLPQQMDEAELGKIISEAISETGATSMKDMGKVIALANSRIKGRAEGKVVAELVKKALS